MSTMSMSGISEEQKNQYRQYIKEAVKDWCDLTLSNVQLDDKGMENFLSRADEFKAVIARAIVSFTRSISSSHNQLDKAEVKPLFDHYYSQYKPKPITEQISRLRELIPGLGSANERFADLPLPNGAEGYFAIPRWEVLAPTYVEALEKMFTLLHDNLKWDVWDKTREGRFFNFRKGRIGSQYLRDHEQSSVMWKHICEAQKGHDIIVVPAQFGLKYAGISVPHAKELMGANEFGLSTFAVGAMLLTHRRRMLEFDDLWMYCPGDEYSLNGDGRFEATPLYFFGNGMMEFDVINQQRSRCGVVSGFIQMQR